MISELYPDTLTLDGFDDCIIGVTLIKGIPKIAYNQNKILQKLQQEMTEDEAIEYFEYNIQGAYMGENTPIYVEIMTL